MEDIKSFKQNIFSITDSNFEQAAIKLFKFQAENNEIYRQYIRELGIKTGSVRTITQIPFLPIALFRNHPVKTGNWKEEAVFQSSGTTNLFHSRHFIESLKFYKLVSESIFKHIFGNHKNFIFLALLPSYLEQKNSSLVYMMNHFIELSNDNNSGFYLNDVEKILFKINELSIRLAKKIILWGVTYALLDLAQDHNVDLRDAIVIETGGMKGRREEMIREEVHEILMKRFHVPSIYSEYGMTELLSQAYSVHSGKFKCPPWMKVYLRDISDPFFINNKLNYGGINVIDLANIHSCAFIETEDLGKVNEHDTFEIIGRIDNSDLRGCNLLVN